MKYDFTSLIDRHGKDALAVDCIGKSVPWAKAPEAPKEGFSAIPMWVADMNFPAVPTIPEEIIKRVSHTTHAAESGRSGRSRKQWRSSVPMIAS